MGQAAKWHDGRIVVFQTLISIGSQMKFDPWHHLKSLGLETFIMQDALKVSESLTTTIRDIKRTNSRLAPKIMAPKPLKKS